MHEIFTLFAGTFWIVTMCLTLFVFGIGWPIVCAYILWRGLHDLRRIAVALEAGRTLPEAEPDTPPVRPARWVRLADDSIVPSAFGR